MIPFRHTTHKPIRNLPQLLKTYHDRGGSIIQYQSVISFVVISQKSTHHVWVPADGSLVLRSLPYTLSTLLFGWWSLFGFFWTIQVLYSNLGGGVDVTDDLLAATRGGDVAWTQEAIDEQIKEGRRQSLRAVALFLVIVCAVALMGWVAITIGGVEKQPAPNPPVSARQRATNRGATTTNAPEGTVQATPAPVRSVPPPRLQAIFYDSGGRSTTIINGRTVSVGESASGYTVMAIKQGSVTLRLADGKELVLNLADVK